MIRYSSYGSTNHRAPSSQIIYLDPLEADYHELQELRERVRKAEAAARTAQVPAGLESPGDISCFSPLDRPLERSRIGPGTANQSRP